MSENLIFDTEIKEIQKTYKSIPLVSEYDPILKKQMPIYYFNGIEDIEQAKELKGVLIQTLKERNGFGLSANQCGIEANVFVLWLGEDKYNVYFNPSIMVIDDTQIHMEEGCLSFPSLILGINRPTAIYITYQDEYGRVFRDRYEGMTARICMHETDHLSGITFDTKAKPLALKSGKKRRAKYLKRVIR